MITFADIVLKIASTFTPIVRGVADKAGERRKDYASLLASISECLESMAALLREPGLPMRPFARCRELEVYLMHLKRSDLLRHLEEKDVNKLISALTGARYSRESAIDILNSRPMLVIDDLEDYERIRTESSNYNLTWNRERFEGMTEQDKVRFNEEVSKIEQASGLFRGMANILRAGS